MQVLPAALLSNLALVALCISTAIGGYTASRLEWLGQAFTLDPAAFLCALKQRLSRSLVNRSLRISARPWKNLSGFAGGGIVGLAAATTLIVLASGAHAQSTGTGGVVINQQYVQGLGYGNNAYLIATLAASNPGTYDHLHLVATLNAYDYSWSETSLDITFANRGGFAYIYSAKGASPTGNTVHIAAYQEGDGSANIYFMLTDYWDAGTYTILEAQQETIYPTPAQTTNQTPPGTLIFDSASSAYPPQTYTDFSGNTTTTNPTPGSGNTLQIYAGTYGIGPQLLLNNPAGYGNGAILFQGFGGASQPVQAQISDLDDGSYSTNLLFSTKQQSSSGQLVECMRIGSTGNVGIGTPSPGSPLEVKGNIAMTSGSGGVLVFQDGTTQSTAAAQLVQSNGNVGIGTNTPGAALEVQQFGQSTGPAAGVGINLHNDSGLPQYGATTRILFEGGASNANGTPADGGNGLQSFAAIQSAGADWNGNNGYLAFQTALSGVMAERMRISPNGAVGIGTQTPATGAILEINGNVRLTAGSGASMTFPDNSVQSTAWNGTTLGGDYAESIDVLGDRTTYEPGDVIAIDASSPGKFLKSAKPYSKLVAGVYSTKPGLVGRRATVARIDKDAEVPMAMMGIAPTKVSAENGPIELGDLLVTSSTPGYAMRATDATRTMGAVIGKALAPLPSGKGVIEVLISLQ